MKTLVVSSFMLGGLTGFIFRNELNFPTNMRIKRAVLEHHLLSRKKVDTDLLEIID